MKINTPYGLQEVRQLFDFVVDNGRITDTNGQDLGWNSGLTLILSEAQAAELIELLSNAIENKKYKSIYLGLVGEMHQIKEGDLPVEDKSNNA